MGKINLLFIILISSALTLSTHAKVYNWNSSRGYQDFKYGTNESLLIKNNTDSVVYDLFMLPNQAHEITLKFKARNLSGHPMGSYRYQTQEGITRKSQNPFWGLFILSDSDTVTVTSLNREIAKEVESEPAAEISLRDGALNIRETITLTNGINPFDGYNIWSVTAGNGKIIINAGNHGLKEIMGISCDIDTIYGIGFLAGWGGGVEVKDISLTISEFPEDSHNKYDLKGLEEYFSESKDPMEGYWTLFDRELEETLLKMGGDYRLACIKEGDNYVFIYLDGAVVNRSSWEPGDIKAVICPSPFPGIYDIQWLDSQKEPMSHEIKGQIGEGNTLTIQFPYQSSKLRFRKIR